MSNNLIHSYKNYVFFFFEINIQITLFNSRYFTLLSFIIEIKSILSGINYPYT